MVCLHRKNSRKRNDKDSIYEYGKCDGCKRMTLSEMGGEVARIRERMGGKENKRIGLRKNVMHGRE